MSSSDLCLVSTNLCTICAEPCGNPMVNAQVASLQDANAALLSELEEARTAVAKRRAEAMLGAGAAAAGAGGNAGSVASASSGADKDLLLKHIESLKEVRLRQLAAQEIRIACLLLATSKAAGPSCSYFRRLHTHALPRALQARQDAGHLRHECRRLEGELALSQRRLEALKRQS